MRKNRQTNDSENSTTTTAVGVGIITAHYDFFVCKQILANDIFPGMGF